MTLNSARSTLLRLLRDQRGQAMVEYSTITFAFLIGSGVLMFGAPLSQFGGKTLVEALFDGLQIYINTMFYCLSLAVT